MRCAVTISLVPEARGGPFVFWDDVAAGVERAAALGFGGVEVFPPSVDRVDWTDLERLLKTHRIALAAVGTGGGWVVQRLRVTDPDPAHRHKAIDFVGSIVDAAGKLGAPAIVGSIQGQAEGDVSREQALTWLAEALAELAPRAKAHGVPLLIEPINRYETNLVRSVDEALAFIDGHRLRNVKILCDLFHMNIEEVSIPDSLRKAGSLVGHVHFADSNRHAVGFGHTNILPIADALREIGYGGFLSAEVLPLPDPEAAARRTIESFRKYVSRESP